MKLQSNIAHRIRGMGEADWQTYRAFRSDVRQAEEPYRFVDGELIEKFLEMSEAEQTLAVEGDTSMDRLGMEAEDVRALVEGLRRLH